MPLVDNNLPIESLREAARIDHTTRDHFELVDRLLLWSSVKSPAARLFRLMAGKLVSRMANQRTYLHICLEMHHAVKVAMSAHLHGQARAAFNSL